MNVLLQIFSVCLLVFLVSCDKNDDNGGLVSHNEQEDGHVYFNYVYIKNMQQPGHPRIYKENSKSQIIEHIHKLIVCGDSSNVANSEIKNESVNVTCITSIWGPVIENRLRASITNSTEYNTETDTFEQGRTVTSLVQHGGKTIIIGTKSEDHKGVLGIASNIPNLETDPEKYRSEGMKFTDLQSGKVFYSKNLTALQYDMLEFFKEDGEKGKKIAIHTAQHEIGHLFGLFHTFQFFGSPYVVYNDLIIDTPTHHPSDCSDEVVDENIMSYCSSEIVFRTFTSGQIERMNKVLELEKNDTL